MSVEVIAIVVSAVGLAVTVLGGMFTFARFFLSRMDRKFDEVHEEFRYMREQFRDVREEFRDVREEFRNVREEIAVLRSDLHVVAEDVVDLKVAVARIEGPRPRLLPAR